MTITEATRQAMAEGKNIARRWYDTEGERSEPRPEDSGVAAPQGRSPRPERGRAERRIIIKPETSPDCCLIWVEGSKRPPAVRWNPDADDLISDAWEITGDWYEP